MSKPRKYRKVSLRLSLFVLMPLCALTFLLVSRVSHAREQLRILRALQDQAIVEPFESNSENDVWWEAFWGGDPMLSIDYAYISGTPDQWAAIGPLTNLKTLDLNEPAGDLYAKQMRDFIDTHPRLESVRVFGSLSEDVWREVSRAAELKHLLLGRGCNISDVSLSYFAHRALTELELSRCPNLTDNACQSIANMRTLKNLNLAETSVSDRGIAVLRDLPLLEELRLSKTAITGAGLEVLQLFSRLTLLDVSYCELQPEAFEQIAKLRNLHHLHLDGTPATDERLAALTHISEIESLHIAGTQITDEATKQIARFKSLKQLSLSSTRVTDRGLQRLEGLSELEVLFCERAYVSPSAMNRLGDVVTQDRTDGGIVLAWHGAARIDTVSGKLSGYLPAYPGSLSDNWAAEYSAPVAVFGVLPSAPMISIRDVDAWSMDITLKRNRLLAFGNGILTEYELPSGQRLRSVPLVSLGSSRCPIRMVGKQLLTFHYANCKSWDADTGQQLGTVPVAQVMANESVVRGNRLALLDLQGVDVLTVLGKTVDRKRYPGDGKSTTLRFPFFLGAGFGDDGQVIVAQVSEQNGPIEIRDLSADQLLATIPTMTHTAVLSANAKVLAVPSVDEAAISIWNALSGEKIADVAGPFDSSRMKFTPDGRYLIVAVPNDVIKAEYQ